MRELTTDSHRSILISTHDIETAIMYSDQLWLVNKGRIEHGVPEDLILNGKLEQAFTEKDLFFDYERGHFKKKFISKKPIGLSGDPILKKWTKKRIGEARIQNYGQGKAKYRSPKNARF